MRQTSDRWAVRDEVRQAIDARRPVVAFESTVITHGLPYPQSVELGIQLEEIAREEGCVPATIGVVDGVIHVGMTRDEIDRLACERGTCKAAGFDLAYIAAMGLCAGTTVSATLAVAERAGIRVFATGGIGGVHRGAGETFDISHDLQALARSRVVTVCAGAKAILDLPKTIEYLETVGVCVVGYRTATLPAFYYRDSGIPLNYSAQSADDIARVWAVRRDLDLQGGLLVVAPVPEEKEFPAADVNAAIDSAMKLAGERGVHGKDVTPFLLAQLAEITGGHSVDTNVALLENNARVAAGIAWAISERERA